MVNKDIKVWYKFRPKLKIWTSKNKRKSYIMPMLQETWYGIGGSLFCSGYFVFIQCGFVAIHIRIEWWHIKSCCF